MNYFVVRLMQVIPRRTLASEFKAQRHVHHLKNVRKSHKVNKSWKTWESIISFFYFLNVKCRYILKKTYAAWSYTIFATLYKHNIRTLFIELRCLVIKNYACYKTYDIHITVQYNFVKLCEVIVNSTLIFNVDIVLD
jgi:hypothetical protein